MAGTLGTAWLVFSAPNGRLETFTFLLIPFILWAAIRHGMKAVVLMNLGVSGIVLWLEVKDGLARFTAPMDMRLLAIDSFLFIFGATAILLAVLVEERRVSTDALRESRRNTAVCSTKWAMVSRFISSSWIARAIQSTMSPSR